VLKIFRAYLASRKRKPLSLTKQVIDAGKLNQVSAQIAFDAGSIEIPAPLLFAPRSSKFKTLIACPDPDNQCELRILRG
jgi:hypothetical protein